MINDIAKLREVGEGFESLMISQMVKNMRKTTLTSEDSLFGTSFAENTFRDLLDVELSNLISQKNNLGIAENIIGNYEKHVQGGEK